ncbi:MAG: regulatory protein RecX [Acutalibacteraceae bacterium]
MTVTSKNGKAGKIHLYIDGEYRLTVSDVFWRSGGIRDGDYIDEEGLAYLMGEAGFYHAYQNGIRLLSLRSYGKREMFLKLRRKHDEESAQRVADEFEKQGLIDDSAYAKELYEYLYNRKNWDTRRIRLELRARGISPEIIEASLCEDIDNDPVCRIIMLLNTKYSASLSDEKGKRRVFSSLMRMGYTRSDILSAFSQAGVSLGE